MTDGPGGVAEPAYLRWRKDNRIAGTLITASLSLIGDALAVVFGLNVGRGSLLYIGVLLAAALVSGLLMTHNRIALSISKPLVLILAGTCILALSLRMLNGVASVICCAISAVLALVYVVIARGANWNAFWNDVQTGDDTPAAAVRALRNDR